MRTVRLVLALGLALLMVSPVLAQHKKGDKEKKAPVCPAAQCANKLLEGITLTDDQKAKIAEVTKEYGPKLAEAIKKTDVWTADQKKAREEAAKTAKAAGKKGKDVKDAVDAAATLTDDQKAKKAEADKAVKALEKDVRAKVTALLTPEQQEQLKKLHETKKKK
jgi:hypothetical protein